MKKESINISQNDNLPDQTHYSITRRVQESDVLSRASVGGWKRNRKGTDMLSDSAMLEKSKNNPLGLKFGG
jgi:hypothetical protein